VRIRLDVFSLGAVLYTMRGLSMDVAGEAGASVEGF
jgi:hypothetical protein